MKKLIFAATFSLTIFSISLNAQTKKININGKIISFEESFPLEGVNITVKGTKNITGTQADGTFSLSVEPDDKILVVKLIGYESQEVKINGTREYSIVLRKENTIAYSKFFFRDLSLLSIGEINLN